MSNKSKRDTTVKLYRQFPQLTPENLLKPLRCASESWKNDEELKHHIQM